jgi:hypothetical protein
LGWSWRNDKGGHSFNPPKTAVIAAPWIKAHVQNKTKGGASFGNNAKIITSPPHARARLVNLRTFFLRLWLLRKPLWKIFHKGFLIAAGVVVISCQYSVR